MAKILIVYYSRSGNTKKMAYMVQKGVMEEGVDVDTKDVKDVGPTDLLKYDGIIIGSPTYYGLPSAEIKELLDKTYKIHGKLDGKVGGAFTSSHHVGGGNETTILAILEAMLVHGMIIYGDADADHYGPVALLKPTRAVEKNCVRYGKRIAGLTKRLHG
jgi:NAD(P)H dehydrogenase (quinone)